MKFKFLTVLGFMATLATSAHAGGIHCDDYPVASLATSEGIEPSEVAEYSAVSVFVGGLETRAGFTGVRCGPYHPKTGMRTCCYYEGGQRVSCEPQD